MNFPRDDRSLSRFCGWWDTSAAILLVGTAVVLLAGYGNGLSAREIDFNQDIRPLLSDNCFACHGPDKNTREADLRLDIRDEALKSYDGVRPIIPGKADSSEVILRIFTEDEDDVMPPPKTGKKLTAAQKAMLKQWVNEGAVYQEHWSFQPLQKAGAPEISSGNYGNDLTDIDRILLKRLNERGLDFSDEADPVTLIRRLSFDLLGLPAKWEWVDQFRRNPSDEVYLRIVEEMLASPHFGERMAVFWLDLVRYADTIGYHSDSHREVSGFRDYVVNAFNTNKRYDQFTVEQLAGDLLPGDDTWQRIASGYNRLLQTTEEGGAQAKEYRAIYAADRVRNVSGVWLGTTLGCAQCHDHKYDPFTAHDFYSMAAFFSDINEPAVGRQNPNFDVPDLTIDSRMNELESRKAYLASAGVRLSTAQVFQFKSVEPVKQSSQFINLGDAGSEAEHSSKMPITLGSLGASGTEPVSKELSDEGLRSIAESFRPVNESIEWRGVTSSGQGENLFVVVRVMGEDNNQSGATMSVTLGGAEVVSGFSPSALAGSGNPVLIDLSGANSGDNHEISFEVSGSGRVVLCGIGSWGGIPDSMAFTLAKADQLASEIGQGEEAVRVIKPTRLASSGGADLKDLGDGSYLSTGANPDKDTYTVTIPVEKGFKSHGVFLEALRHDSLENKSLSRANGNFVLTEFEAYLVAGESRKKIELGKPFASFEQSGWPVVNTIDGKSNTGWAVEGWQKIDDRKAVFPFKSPVSPESDATIEVVLKHESAHTKHNIGRFRLSMLTRPVSKLDDIQPLAPEIAGAIREIKDLDATNTNPSALIQLVGFAREKSSSFSDLRNEIAGVDKSIGEIKKRKRTMLVVDRVEPRMTRVLPRGNWLDDSGEEVLPAVPAFLPQGSVFAKREDAKKRASRLELAQWIMDRENPLTSRAFANRVWKIFFGYGISRNLEDLGGQGQPPTHPLLLDYLADRFMESGWNIKDFVRMLVISRAYRQTSTPTEWLQINDPGNRLFARQSRFRVDAEFVRDTALSVSGLLVDKVGGGNARPYQPAGYWQHLNFPKRKYQADDGEGLYRRGLYTFWCRTFLHPAMLAFDAPSREECTAERPRSNTPQQALVLLNDIEFVEAANALADAAIYDLATNKALSGKLPVDLATGGVPQYEVMAYDTSSYNRWSWPELVIQRMFERATGRFADSEELSVLKSLYLSELGRFKADVEGAKALLGTGKNTIFVNDTNAAGKAALANVARAIMNLYETTARY